MSAYVIFTRERTQLPDELATYGELAIKSISGHEVSPLVLYGKLDMLEGPTAEGAVVMEFPDLAAAHAWYRSPEYQAAAVHRRKGADYRVFIVEGVERHPVDA